MSRMNQIRSFALLAVFLSPALAMQAMPPGPPPGTEDGGPGPTAEQEARMLKHMTKHLGLSTEQVKKIQAIHANYRPKMVALHEKIEPLRKQLMERLTAQAPQRTEIEQIMRKLADLRVEMQLLQFDRHQEVSAVLTPAQKEKWHGQMEKHRKEHGHDHHKHMGPGDNDQE